MGSHNLILQTSHNYNFEIEFITLIIKIIGLVLYAQVPVRPSVLVTVKH